MRDNTDCPYLQLIENIDVVAFENLENGKTFTYWKVEK